MGCSGCKTAARTVSLPSGDPDFSGDEAVGASEGAADTVRLSPRMSPRRVEVTEGAQGRAGDKLCGWCVCNNFDAWQAVLVAQPDGGVSERDGRWPADPSMEKRCTPRVPKLHLPATPAPPAQGAKQTPVAVTQDRGSAEDPREKMLRRKRLVLATIVLAWLACGALVFSSMDLGPVRTFYLMVQIITTVGYGDFVPETQGQKLACTAVVLSSALLVANIVMAFVSDLEDKIGDEVASDMRSMTHRIEDHIRAGEEQRASMGGDCPTEELVRPNNMALQQQEQRRKRTFRELRISSSIFIFCLAAGVVFFRLVDACSTHECEDDENHVHTWTDALYLSVITMTTVGFGDIVPQSKVGQTFSALWMMVGVAVTVRLLGSVSSVIDHTLRADVQVQMTRQLFHESDENGDGQLDVLEFMKLQFVQNGLVSKDQFESVRSQFKLVAGQDDHISIDEYAAYFLPEEK